MDGFQDVTVLRDLCAKLMHENGTVYFIDAQEKMDQRLRKGLKLHYVRIVSI